MVALWRVWPHSHAPVCGEQLRTGPLTTMRITHSTAMTKHQLLLAWWTWNVSNRFCLVRQWYKTVACDHTTATPIVMCINIYENYYNSSLVSVLSFLVHAHTKAQRPSPAVNRRTRHMAHFGNRQVRRVQLKVNIALALFLLLLLMLMYCEIWKPIGGAYEDYDLPGSDAVYFGRYVPKL